MKKYWIAFFILSLFGVQKVWANGGPVAWTETTPVGAIGFDQSADVTLKKEVLDIKIISLNNYSINAYYELFSTKSINKLKFGVPINWFVDFMEDVPKGQLALAKQEPTEKTLAEINTIAKGISISLNNRKISNTPVLNRHLFGLAKEEDFRSNAITRIRGWCIAELNLNKGINKITLEYSGKLDFLDMQFTKSALTEFSDRKLNYLLYPAGYWNGVVDEIKVNIDPGPYYDHIEFLTPTSVFTQSDRTWVWHGSQIDLKKISSIQLVLSKCVVAAKELSNWNNHSYVKFNDCALVKSSSELAPIQKITYSANNILDGNVKTAWCADKSNDSENMFLEFRSKQETFASSLKQYCNIEGLMLTTGYIKNQNIYSSNNRIKKIAISDCNGKYRDVYSLKPDKDFRFGAALIKNEIPQEAWNKFINAYRAKHGNDYTHPDYDKAPKPKMDFIKQASCFRVEIIETEGSEANDTCISEVALVINCF